MQQSTCGGVAISKQRTQFDKEEEKKEKFNFAFFSSCFDAAIIATGTELEKAAAGEPDQTGCEYGDVITAAAVTEEDPADAHSGVVQAAEELATAVDNATA